MTRARQMALELPKLYSRIPSWEPPREDVHHSARPPGYSAFDSDADRTSAPPWRRSLPHVCVATLTGVLFGYHIGVVNIPLEYIAQDLGFAGDALAEGFVVSIFLVGAFFGCAFSGVAADKYGRRRILQLSALPMIIGTAFSALASGGNVMWLGRCLVGIGLGLGGPVMAMYVSEISPTSVRGTFGSLCQIANCLGILGALLASYPASSVANWWRVCFWISIIPAVGLLVGMQFCVESPRWLFKQSRRAEAERVLESLWGPAYVKVALDDLVTAERSEDTSQATWGVLYSMRYRRVVGIGAALFALQQLSGINAIFYFSTTVFKDAGVKSDVAASVSVGVVNLSASCWAAYLMDHQGRRSLLLYSFSGMALAMAVQVGAYRISALHPIQGYLSLGGTLMFVFMFALGAGPVPGLLLPEIFADQIRGKAMSICMCVHWVTNFVVGFSFLPLMNRIGAGGVYAFFTAASVSAAYFVKNNLLETKGKTLEELETLLIAR